MALGFGLLRLSPDAFWSLTMPELAAALRGASGQIGGIGEMPDLSALMSLFPDEPGVCDG